MLTHLIDPLIHEPAHWCTYMHHLASLHYGRRVNSLAPGKFDYSLKLLNFKLISMKNISSIFYEITIRWVLQHLTDHKSTLLQVMAWCRQAPSHYLSQCWPRSLSSYDITRPQWVKQISSANSSPWQTCCPNHAWCDLLWLMNVRINWIISIVVR